MDVQISKYLISLMFEFNKFSFSYGLCIKSLCYKQIISTRLLRVHTHKYNIFIQPIMDDLVQLLCPGVWRITKRLSPFIAFYFYENKNNLIILNRTFVSTK